MAERRRIDEFDDGRENCLTRKHPAAISSTGSITRKEFGFIEPVQSSFNAVVPGTKLHLRLRNSASQNSPI